MNALTNATIDECNVNELGIVEINELLDDNLRHYLLAIMATKFHNLEQGIQLIGMRTKSMGRRINYDNPEYRPSRPLTERQILHLKLSSDTYQWASCVW